MSTSNDGDGKSNTADGADGTAETVRVNPSMMAEDMIRQRIAHTLWIYPKLSPSMLQIGIGTGFPPALWHPVLELMIREGVVNRRQVQAQNPVSKRDQTYTILENTPTPPQTPN